MKVKPKIEKLDLENFLKEKSKLLDIPVTQLREIVSYGVRCHLYSMQTRGGEAVKSKYGNDYFKKLRAKSKRNPVVDKSK